MSAELFFDTFQAHADGEAPDGWIVEQHTELDHPMGTIRGGAYRITFPGNKHLPLIPPVRNFDLTVACRAGRYSASASLYLFFRYHRETETGYAIRHEWNAAGTQTLFGIYRQGAFEKLADARSDLRCADLTVEQTFRLTASGNCFELRQQDQVVAAFSDPQARFAEPGFIALDRGGVKKAYAFELTAVCIESDEAAPEKPVWPALSAQFPCEINGMSVPYIFHLEAERSGGRVVAHAFLSGGPAERPPSVIDFRGRWANERMLNPYVRFELPGGKIIGPYALFRGTVGLCEHWSPKSSGFPPSGAECPVGQDLYLPELPAESIVVFGYEQFAAEDRLTFAGGPTEMALEPGTGRMLYAGPALSAGAVFLEIESPRDKQICARIPAGAARYAQARAFAEANHFFCEAEPVRFALRLRHRAPALRFGALTAHWTLENVYREPLAAAQETPLRPTKKPEEQGGVRERVAKDLAGGLEAVPGLEIMESAWLDFKALAPGVYHIRAEVFQGQARVAAVRRAFEVLADDPTRPAPPLLSGLPELIPLLPDYATAADGFDPWFGAGVDSCHYLAASCFQPLVARENRSWELVHFYRRKWLLWLATRTTPDPSLAANADLLRHADWVYPYERTDLWKPLTYQNPEVLRVLADFLRSDAFRPEPGTALDVAQIEKDQALSTPAFLELMRRQWKPWTKFFNCWFIGTYLPELRKSLDRLGPNARMMHYDVYPPYTSVYKAAYFPTYMGHDLTSGIARHLEGPMIWEDYPWMCGYPLQRGVFQLAAIKSALPNWRHYPEVYCVNGCADDRRVVYGMPPYGSSYPPRGFFTKTFLEYAYAAVWFDKQGFHFWDDNGFQAMCWDREHFDEFLEAWSFIVRHPPERPLRTTAFAYSRPACDRHPDKYKHAVQDLVFQPDAYGWGDMFNTAEEGPAFVYEQARRDGQPAGFVVALEAIGRLRPEDVDVVVLPPLSGVSAEERRAVRALHEQGVNLLGMEDVAGLEDLFGVRELPEPLRVDGIRVARAPAPHPLAGLEAMTEPCVAPEALVRYELDGGRSLLEGCDARGNALAPTLVAHQTRWGRTACFTLPPTMVRRADYQDILASYGKESISLLVNLAAARILRFLGRPLVETTQGKLIAFRDRQGHAHVIVEEDAHPRPALPIDPVITLRMANLKAEMLSCTKHMAFIEIQPEYVRLRLHLEAHESACIRIAVPGANAAG